jgi:predicted transcriptional regulator YdeE
MQIPKRISYPAKRIIGMAWQQSDEGSISDMWQRFIPRESEIIRQLESTDSYGVCQPLDDGNWRYIAGLPVEGQAAIPAGMVALEIPAREYACIEHRGIVSNLKETFAAAYSEWLPAAGMEVDDGVDFEHYGERFLGPMNLDSIVEIYIPIKPSK